MEQLTMQLIMHGGTARSKAMEAIASAKEGKIDGARTLLAQAGVFKGTGDYCFSTQPLSAIMG